MENRPFRDPPWPSSCTAARRKGADGVDIDHKGPEKCIDCGQDAYIRLAGTEVYVCAHCFADRGRPVRGTRPTGEPPKLSPGGSSRTM